MTHEKDLRPVVTDPDAGEPIDIGHNEDPDTHTSALQGAAGGGMGANATGAGYAGGLLTGSETNTGIADIPDADDDTDDALTQGPDAA
ncbi:MAG TPA: hypothetical protein VFY23_11060 [Candidatus Limnocylindrales bacterium]|nr:hypothetical protein [Candidatus Limnocylindrales bacterium]